jgi:hypothetical protein
MRDQTWKVLQYSILFFLGVVGLEIKVTDHNILIVAYTAVLLTSLFGVIIAFHHRRRQKEKFEIIEIYEKELGIHSLILPVIKKSRNKFAGKINSSTYIVIMQVCLVFISAFMLIKLIIPYQIF